MDIHTDQQEASIALSTDANKIPTANKTKECKSIRANISIVSCDI